MKNRTKMLISDLGKAVSISAKETEADINNLNTLSTEESADIDINKDKLIEEQIKDIVHYRNLRKQYANRVFWFMCVWSGLTFLVLILKGFFEFGLNDAPLVTLVGGTTVSVIGLVGFIIQGLFNSNNHSKSK